MENEKSFSIADLQKHFKQRNEAIQAEKDDTLNIIGHWLEKTNTSNLSDHDKKQKNKELVDLAKFILCYDKNITISEGIRESPDFVVQLKNQKIGVELRDLNIDEDAKKTEGTIASLFEAATLKLNEDLHKGVYRVNFHEEVNLKNNIEAIVAELVKWVQGNVEHPQFISSVEKSPGDDVFFYHSEASENRMLNIMTVKDAIQDKEALVSKYTTEAGLKQCWLLLVLGGVQESSDYSDMDSSLATTIFNTEFEKVFIFNFFTGEVKVLKTSPMKV